MYKRQGESEYTVNGQNVRLKDIYEMFLDTGLGLSLIHICKAARPVGMTPGRRRQAGPRHSR